MQALLLWAPAQIILIFYILFIFGIFDGRLRMIGNASTAIGRGGRAGGSLGFAVAGRRAGRMADNVH